jgi:DNA-directed RNA polymerase specialized sigma24 family protein
MPRWPKVIVHQVFVRLLRRGPAADAVLATGAYLRQAVRNECYSWLRDRQAVAIDRDDGTPRLEPAGPASQDDRG